MRPFTAALAAALVLVLLSAASAGAAVRLATPSGVGASPCNPNPCSLATAVNGAQDGDQVAVGGGTYLLSTEITVDKDIDVGGAPGSPAPTVKLALVQFIVDNPGATIHDLGLVLDKPAMAAALTVRSGTAERVFADGRLGAAGCVLTSGALRNSVCLEGLNMSAEEPGTYSPVVSNVLADPIYIGAGPAEQINAEIVNSIAIPADGSAPNGVLISASIGGGVDATLRNSNYAGVGTSLSTGTDYTFTAPGTNGNQVAPAQFVDVAALDFRPLASSPTVDAGLAIPALGSTDLAGLPRSQPRCIGGAPVPDIGPYEFQPTEACPAPPAPPSNRVGFGKLARNLRKGTVTLPVDVPGAGDLRLAGSGVVGRKLSPAGKRRVNLVVKAKGGKSKTLRRTGRVTVKAKVTFTPAGGTARTVSRSVTLKLKPPAGS